MKTQQIWKYGFLVVMVLGSVLTACTKYDTPMEVEEEGKTASRASIEKYVLWINLDGAGGGDLAKNAFPENGTIKGMLPHSRYSWNGMEAEHVEGENYVSTAENAIASASMLTGNIPLRHGMSDNTYQSEQVFDPDFDESLKAYPGFFQYITDYNKSMKTLAITPWKTLNDKLLDEASVTFTSTSDEETLNKALQNIDEENNRVIYLSFRSVLDAAVSGGGWNTGNTAYVEAMSKMDDYIGQLLDAVRARPNYYYEDWLVVVTSNHGGTANGTYGGMSLEERSMFGIFYYDHFTQPKEMNPGVVEDVLCFDRSFYGTVIDSITRTPDLKDIATMRQIYSPDSLDGGMTVEFIMAARPSNSHSYVPWNQDGINILSKGNWYVKLDHTYTSGAASFFGQSDGTMSQNGAANFLNPMVHTLTSTMKLYNSEAYIETKEETGNEYDKDGNYVGGDQWGNITPPYTRYISKRRGKLALYNYYDGIKKTASATVIEKEVDKESRSFIDNFNLEINGGMRNSCRYILEIRIWNKEFAPEEVVSYSNKLKLPASDPNYKHLIGYWQFYKGDNGQYIQDDSIVVNQIKTVKKRFVKSRTIGADGKEVVEYEYRDIPTEGIRLRKKIVGADGRSYYTNIKKEEGDILRYMTMPNTLYQTMLADGRMMESVLPVPAVLEWMGVPFPTETTRDQKFKTSKLDGVASSYEAESKKVVWRGMFLGDYTKDLEWRDYDK